MAHAPDHRRRRWLGMLLASAVVPASGAPAPLPTQPPQLTPLVNAARIAAGKRDYPAAEGHIARAKAIIDADPEQRWALRMYVLPVLAFVVLEQGRADEALVLMRSALRSHDRALVEWPEHIGAGMERLDRSLGNQLTRVEYNRHLVRMVHSAQTLGTIDDLAEDLTLQSMDVMWVLLARTLHANGQAGELARLYHERVATIALHDDDIYRLVAHEYRLYKIGLFLMQAGRHADAEHAWRLGRQANARRLHGIMRSKVLHTVLGASAMRRRLLSASIPPMPRGAWMPTRPPCWPTCWPPSQSAPALAKRCAPRCGATRRRWPARSSGSRTAWRRCRS